MYIYKYQKAIWSLVVLLLISVAIARDGFALVLRQTVEELTVKADRILVGEVVEIKSEWNEKRTTIYTYVTVLVEQDIKGSSDKKEVIIRVPGGTVDGMTLKVSDVPQFKPKEKVMVFLEHDELTYFRVSGWFQGKYTIKNNKVIEKKIRLKDFIDQIHGIMKTHGIQEEISPTKSMEEKPSTLQKRQIHIYNEEIGNKIKKNIKIEEQKRRTPNHISPSFSSASETGWTTIMSENFEGVFPSAGWTLLDLGYYPGEYYWGKDDYKPYRGSYSAWCARSGANGLDPQFNNYPNYCESWAMYGPFDLSDANQAEVSLNLWLKSEYGYDWICFFVSIDGYYWYGEAYTGDFGGWLPRTFDLTDVYVLGDVTGEPQVWIAAYFESDSSNTDKGAFIDDVVLRKYIAETPPVINSISPSSGSAGTNTSVTISGSNFGSQDASSSVTFFKDGGRINANITSWSNTSIQCTVPSGASSGDVRVTTSGGMSNGVQFMVTFGYEGVKWYDSDIPVPYYINENGTPDCTNEFIAIQNALQTWEDVSGAYMDFEYVGTTSKTGSNYDGYNVMSWGSTSGAVAINYCWSLGDRIMESDIVFNSSLQWSDSGEAGKWDVQNVATHEAGHSLSLTDLYGSADSEKTMYGIGAIGEIKKRTLEAEDEQGIVYIYGGPPIICSVSGIVFDSSSNPVEGVRVEYDSLTSEFWKDAYTDTNGTFTLTGLPSGLGSIQAEPEIDTGYAWSIDSPCNYIYLSPGENRTGYLIILEEGALVSGYMKDSSENPLTNFDEWYYSGKATGGWDYTDGNGLYEIRLPLGRYRVNLDIDPDNFYRALPKEITVTDTTQPMRVPDIIAYSTTDGTTISGSVNNPSGYSKTGVFIVGAIESGTMIDANTIYGLPIVNMTGLPSAGPFSLDPLPPGVNYDVFLAVENIETSGLFSFTVRDHQDDIPGGTSGISLDYTSEGSRVSGNVTDGANGILGAYIVFTDQSTGKCAGITVTDQNGNYTIYNMPAGIYTVEATHSKYGKGSTTVTVTEGVPATVPTIILVYDVVINEFLPNPDGENVEWVELYNKGTVSIDIGGCWIDDTIGGGGSPREIPSGTIIKARGYYSLTVYNGDGYLNNTEDTVNFLMPDGTTVIDGNSYDDVSAYPDSSIYRYPDGEDWAPYFDDTPTRDVANDGPARVITIEVTDTSGAPGQTDVVVPITVNDATGIAGVDVTLLYDSSILTATEVRTTSLTSDFSLQYNVSVPGEISLSMAKATGIESGSGSIVEILFDVASDAVVGSASDLTLSSTSLYDEHSTEIPSSAVNGTFTVTQEKGDINNDGRVNSADAILCLRFAVGLDEPTPAERYAADMNDDGRINSADAIKILRKAVGLE